MRCIKKQKRSLVSAAILTALGLMVGVQAKAQTSSDVAGHNLTLPSQWTLYAGDVQHNSVFAPVPGSALARLSGKISWRYAEANALPLSLKYGKDGAALGPRSAPVKTTQFLGNAVGVSVVGDVLYAESDSGDVYALNAATGHLIWSTHVDNAAMGDPVVVDGRVFIGTGDTGFSFSQVLQVETKVAQHKPFHLVRGLAWSAVYALDAKTGKVLWRYGTKGEDMPSECYANDTLYFGNGDGHLYALNPATGDVRWKTHIGGFDSMSSCNIYDGKIFAGFTDPNDLAAVDMQTGKLVWKTSFPDVANTGMGDNSPTVDLTNHLVIQVSIADAEDKDGHSTVNTAVFAVDPDNGKVMWKTLLGRGATPPAYKASVAIAHDGIIYVSSPTTNNIYALDGATGHILWQSLIPYPEAPGLGRGAVAYDNGVLYQATGTALYAWDAKTGHLLNSKIIGGRFGIDNPVIVGKTMFLSNSWGWLMAMPLSILSVGH